MPRPLKVRIAHANANYQIVIDGRGYATRTDYDALGRVKQVTHDYVVPTGLDPRADAVTRHNTPVIDTTTYSPYGEQVTQTTAVGTTGESSTTDVYDDSGRLVQVIQPKINSTDASGPVWTYTYDAYGDQTSTVDPRNGVTNSTWNPTGRNDLITKYAYDEQGRRISRTLPDGQVESWTYDSLGRVASHTDFTGHDSDGVQHDGTYTVYVYDDNTSLPTSEQTNLGRLAEELRYASYAAYQANATPEVTHTCYESMGRVSRVDDAGRVTDYEYDAEGRLVLEGDLTSDDTVTEVIGRTYDAPTGRLTETKTSKTVAGLSAGPSVTSGVITDEQFGYDTLGRLKSVTLAVAGGQAQTVGSAYQQKPYDATGHRSSVFSTAPVTVYAYDADGNQTAETLSDGVTQAYTFDDMDRLTDEVVTDSASHLLASFHYDLRADGQRTAETEQVPDGSGGLTTHHVAWQYDGLDRLINETYDAGNDGLSGAGDYVDAYAYDPVGNRLSKTHDDKGDGQMNTAADATTTYAYGAANGSGQLTSLNGDDWLLSERTAAGDGTVTTTTYGYNAQGSMTSKAVVTTPLNGTPTASPVETYAYDLRQRLYQVDRGGTLAVQYGYDQDGNRVSETDYTGSSAVTTANLVDTQNPTGYGQTLEAWQGAAGTQAGQGTDGPTTTYVLGNRVMAQVNRNVTSGILSMIALLSDGHGNTRAVLDATGGVATGQIFAYDAFGNRVDANQSVGTLTDLLYTGERFDPSLGQYYWRARPYLAGDGRFSQFDSYESSDPAALHKFVYANNNPLLFLDPTGHTALTLNETLGALTIAAIVVLALMPKMPAGGFAASMNAMSAAMGAATDLLTSGVTALEDEGAILMQNLAGFTKKVGAALAAAAAVGKTISSPPKVFPVPQLLIPTIYRNTVAWLALSPQYYILTYPGPNRAAAAVRRRAAIGARGPAGKRKSWDEFPFASTVEGGAGSYVAAVPAWQNSTQGGLLKGFYYGIMKGKSGKFLVLPVP